MFALQEVTWSGILIALIVGLSGTTQVWIAHRVSKKAETAVTAVKDETKRVSDAVAVANTTHTEILLSKNDILVGKVDSLASTVEMNRQLNTREHHENAKRFEKLSEGHETLFGLLVDLDAKITAKPRIRATVAKGT